MFVEISEKSRSIVVLCDEKEKLQADALLINEKMIRMIDEFHLLLSIESNKQKDILNKMADIDVTISKISNLLTY